MRAQAREFDRLGGGDFGGAEQRRGIPVDVLEEFVSHDHERAAVVRCPDQKHSVQRGEGTATSHEPSLLHGNVDVRVVEGVTAWIHDVTAPGA